jgi:single-strand DNA-binding protein
MNTTSFIGRLTKDPEVRTTSTGPIADLRVAVDGPNDRAVYVTVTVFGAQVDAIAGHVAKGRQIGVTGRLAYDQWESECGELRSRLYVISSSVDFLARPRTESPAEVTGDNGTPSGRVGLRPTPPLSGGMAVRWWRPCLSIPAPSTRTETCGIWSWRRAGRWKSPPMSWSRSASSATTAPSMNRSVGSFGIWWPAITAGPRAGRTR